MSQPENIRTRKCFVHWLRKKSFTTCCEKIRVESPTYSYLAYRQLLFQTDPYNVSSDALKKNVLSLLLRCINFGNIHAQVKNLVLARCVGGYRMGCSSPMGTSSSLLGPKTDIAKDVL